MCGTGGGKLGGGRLGGGGGGGGGGPGCGEGDGGSVGGLGGVVGPPTGHPVADSVPSGSINLQLSRSPCLVELASSYKYWKAILPPTLMWLSPVAWVSTVTVAVMPSETTTLDAWWAMTYG